MVNIKFIPFLCLILMGIGCRTVKAPQGTVPTRKNLHHDAFGGYITLSVAGPDSTYFISGELIAVGSDSIVVHPGSKACSFPLTVIDSARLIFFKTQSEAFTAWSFFLTIGSLSNGFYALATFPTGAITGIATSSTEAKRLNYLDFPKKEWKELNKYARFPQGMPPGIRMEDLIPRPAKT